MYKGDAMRAYADSVAYHHEGLPVGKSFATADDNYWMQNQLTGNRRNDQSGHITVPSDMDEVCNLRTELIGELLEIILHLTFKLRTELIGELLAIILHLTFLFSNDTPV